MKYYLKPFYKYLIKQQLMSLQYPSGLFGASHSNVSTGYNKAWIRDNLYEAMGFESQDIEIIKKTYAALFDVLHRHKEKIDWAIKEKPKEKYQYIHARYCPFTYDEFYEDWGNKQNDAIGGFLYKVGDLYKKGIMVIRDRNDLAMLQKLVYYLQSIQYWQDPDNGMWEENEELHASSIGACLAGLYAVKPLVDVPNVLLEQGRKALDSLLPRESPTKETDLALLSLLYPYNIVSKSQAIAILSNVEKILVRQRGVIRYVGDQYYAHNGKEAEWTFGLFPYPLV
ncbi:MAG: glycoside hydrolase family 15 protein [Candidatus Woesearchaeota archaeon]